MERKVAKEITRQHAANKAAANQAAAKHSEADRRAHEAAMAAHLAQHVMASTLTTGAITEDAIAICQAASATTMGEKGSATMRE